MISVDTLQQQEQVILFECYESLIFMQLAFNPDKVKPLIQAAVKQVLDKVKFNSQKVEQWTSTIIETVLKSLRAIDKPFKYIGMFDVKNIDLK